MKKAVFFVFVPVLCALIVFVLMAARFEPTVPSNSFLGPVSVGGLTKSQALAHLQAWWEVERSEKINLRLGPRSLSTSVSSTGLAPDFAQSIAELPMTELFDSAKSAVGASPSAQRFGIKFLQVSAPAKPILTFSRRSIVKGAPARVFYKNDEFERLSEETGVSLDMSRFKGEIAEAISSGNLSIDLPIGPAPAKVTAEDLAKIDSVVSTFTTHFPVRKKDRNTNIRIAAGKINGWVLLPGDKFSFNTVVGRRTIEDGFKEAPVFKDGGHAIDVGGGICQVSTTLYNSALFADLKIVQRHNHSMPVAYVPLGRDATVDYGSLDLVIQNSLDTPIALNSEFRSGTLTFRILGKKDPSLSVKIETSNAQSWDAPTKTVTDAKLPVGASKVIEKGSRGHSILSYRLVYRDNQLRVREPLGRSYYRGGQRIVAIGSGPAAVQMPVVAPNTLPDSPVTAPKTSAPQRR